MKFSPLIQNLKFFYQDSKIIFRVNEYIHYMELSHFFAIIV